MGDVQSCVCWKDKAAIHSILTGEFNTDDIYTYTQMIGIILLVHFMVLTVVHVRKKVVM